MILTRNFVIRAFVALALAAFAGAQTAPTVVISPVPMLQFFDNSGRPLAGGCIATYAGGTTTPLATYTDATGAVPNPNPVVLDASGRAAIWIGVNAIKYVVKQKSGATCSMSSGTILYSVDNIQDAGLRLRADITGPGGALVIGFRPSPPATVTITAGAALNSTYAYDIAFTTAAAACASPQTVAVTSSALWSNLSTMTCAASLWFPSGTAFTGIKPASGATVTLAGAIAAPLVKIFDLSNAGAAIVVKGATPGIYPQWTGAIGDGSGTTDDTTAILQAITTTALSGQCLLSSSAYTFSVSSVVYDAGAKPICWRLNGATINRLTASIGSTAQMVQISTTGDITIDGGTFDMRNGTGAAGGVTGYSLLIYNLTQNPAQIVKITNNVFTGGQSAGFGAEDLSNVTFSGNTCQLNYFAGCSFSGTGGAGGTGPGSVFVHNYSITNNTFYRSEFGLALNFYIQGWTVSGNSFYKSNLTLLQMPAANGVVDGNNFYLPADTGQLADPGYKDGIYCEACNGITISNNKIDSMTGRGIRCQGSQLQIPPGPNIQLSCSNLNIVGNQITNNQGDFALFVQGQSFDGSVRGQKNSFRTNQINGVLECGGLLTTDDADVSGNICSNTQLHAWTLGEDTHWRFAGNRSHNIGIASTDNYFGLLINGDDANSQSGYVENNDFIDDDGAHVMHFGVFDQTLNDGFDSRVRSKGNTIAGASAAWVPAPSGTIIGTGWNAGDQRQNFVSTTNAVTGWQNATDGAGAWNPAGYLGNSGTVSITACGTGAAIVAGAANQFTVHIGTGGVTACSVHWSHAFSGTPYITFSAFNGGAAVVVPYTSALNVADVTFTFPSDASGEFLSVIAQ